MGLFYQRIWRVMASERVRVFLWLVVQQVIMTNVERYRRHLSGTRVCQICQGGEETILHVLRGCPAMAGIWSRLVPRDQIRQFFTASLLEWIYRNLRERGSWPTVFVMAVWWGWKWRCGNIFGGNGKCRDRVKFIKDLAEEVAIANAYVKGNEVRVSRVERLVSWVSPGDGWVKLNTDGASRGNPGFATAGGVLRDHNGAWIRGFAVNIGVCSAPLAELWGVYCRLFIALGRGARRVELEVDSKMVVGFLTTGIADSHPLSFLVRLCYGFLSKDWIVRISHVYREANRLADGLANYAFSLSLGLHLLESRPDVVSSILLDDVAGVSYPRHVQV
ncbi:putative ribonuclease H domain, reverse transcriptase zinc-binding domain-containing protein [Arabidopsis thaliana]